MVALVRGASAPHQTFPAEVRRVLQTIKEKIIAIWQAIVETLSSRSTQIGATLFGIGCMINSELTKTATIIYQKGARCWDSFWHKQKEQELEKEVVKLQEQIHILDTRVAEGVGAAQALRRMTEERDTLQHKMKGLCMQNEFLQGQHMRDVAEHQRLAQAQKGFEQTKQLWEIQKSHCQLQTLQSGFMAQQLEALQREKMAFSMQSTEGMAPAMVAVSALSQDSQAAVMRFFDSNRGAKV